MFETMWNQFICFYLHHKILFWLIVVEAFPLLLMLRNGLALLAEKTVDSCVDNAERERNVASILYFFKDLGPNTASFSIVTLIVDMGSDDGFQTATVWILTIVFFVGIILKEKSRRYINIFYETLKEKRSQQWERSSEH
ncbi:hypothetical protein [Sulfurimonas indica]|uniref:hypothetical protein n=1 Tax=Sulfurimonas TaxID=202746 RepID=UPI001263F0C6|nr:hypothetical protein [Sulfurimonas indica]